MYTQALNAKPEPAGPPEDAAREQRFQARVDAEERLEAPRLVLDVPAGGAWERRERRDPYTAVFDRPQAGHEAVDEDGRPDLAALDDGGAVLVREHATTVVMAQDEVVEPRQQTRRRGSVAAGQRRARQVVELATVLIAESP